MDFSKIKLIVWDLDDTFWHGTLSEGEIVSIPENIKLVKDFADHGIISSVCSKNDRQPVDEKMKELGVDDCFVFNSINWEPKGKRIKETIEDMGLRPVNVLFIDDNTQNLQEAKYYSPELMTAEPDIIPELIKWLKNAENLKDDKTHSRLNQYKVLEQKREAKTNFSSNEEFLKDSDIRVDIIEDFDVDIKERVFELIHRTNQLNFTKFRQEREDFDRLMADSTIRKGYVKVSDRYGDYGIVGFYALKDNELIHFLFSCRTIGQGVEQWVYSQIGFPVLNVVGECVTQLNRDETPSWINSSKLVTKSEECNNGKNIDILFKGGCDLSSVINYLGKNVKIDEEFGFQSENGQNIGYFNHSDIIRGVREWNDRQKEMLNSLPYWDKKIFNSKLWNNDYDIIFLSTLNESHYARYHNKELDITVPVRPYLNISENKIDIEKVGNKYKWEILPPVSPDEYIQFLRFLDEKINPKTKIFLMLGSEKEYNKDISRQLLDEYLKRHLIHKQFNDKIKQYIQTVKNNRFFALEITKFIENDNDYTNVINHFNRKIYYEIASELTRLIKENFSGSSLSTANKKWIFIDNLAYKSRESISKVPGFYSLLKNIYKIIRLKN